ncbi:flagellar biosynthesis repressor FlbT [Jannaschia sp. S6380]|uniref:flagellar biosynthesis repressor FlbT n=1 Tax=Jannaschia sp. S6380 TaxID=2926408 RepID=UPI001FF6078F|nr:flagellar biosynthesis repressor FlbT [Jannaschia sp. S6380]MCK0168268.1 flagellar biosynthesis repressor FlbT [Jannaschia sp. S6380]
MLKFPAGDRIVVNGAVIENVGRGARLRLLTPETQLLRLRDAIDPEAAGTPVGRIAHSVQLMMVGEADMEETTTAVLGALVPLRHAFVAPEDRSRIDRIAAHLRDGQLYQALRQLGGLRRQEASLLAARPG